MHLLDALRASGHVRSVVSFGSGEGMHEGYLANAFPWISVLGVDLREPTVSIPVANLRFLRGDLLSADVRSAIPQGDFVYSIECLEHIEDDLPVLRSMAELVRPGGRLYLELPFANEEEQADPELCGRELALHGHVRPGYSAGDLRRLMAEVELRVESVASAFWFPVQPLVWLASDRLPRAETEPHWRTFLEIASLDLRPGLARDRKEATGIKVLASRPS